MVAKFGVFVDEDHSKLPTLYWLPLNFINDPISHVLLLILVRVVFTFDFLTHCSKKPCYEILNNSL